MTDSDAAEVDNTLGAVERIRELAADGVLPPPTMFVTPCPHSAVFARPPHEA